MALSLIANSIVTSVVSAAVGNAVAKKMGKKGVTAADLETKGLLQSKTVLGVGVMASAEWAAPLCTYLVMQVSELVGLEVAQVDAQFVSARVILVCGAMLAVYGRLKAGKKIGG